MERLTWLAWQQMLSPLQRSDLECFTLFSQKHKLKVKGTRTPDVRISGTLQMTHCLISPFVENRALPHLAVLPTSGIDLPAVRKGMRSPCEQSCMCSHMRSSAAPSSQLITTMSSTQCCPDFSSVFFLCGRRCEGQPREPSSAGSFCHRAERVLC